MLAKKGIDIGDDVDGLPESMRQLIAMQAMESGRPFPRSLMGRPGGPIPYGNGMLIGGDPNAAGKVGMCKSIPNNGTVSDLRSHSPLHLPIAEHRNLASRRAECNGPGRLLFARQSLHNLLH
jgi:hypothetical protein